jgi:glutathione-regulated potassium-efflux system ancillary protein KefG
MKILVVFAHPRFETSIVQRKLLDTIRGIPDVTINDLYYAYPDFHIDVEAEKAHLLRHGIVVLQHPFYWYSVPAIVKEWLDLVLEFNWAYGPQGTALHGKFLMSVLSTGGDRHAYGPGGRNRFHIDEFLTPLNQTAHLCGMGWLKPFIIYSGRHMASPELQQLIGDYRRLIAALSEGSLDPMRLLAPGYVMPFAPHG